MADELIDLIFDLSDLGIDSIVAKTETGNFDHLEVSWINPDSKDIKRAKDLRYLPKRIDAGGPLQSKANPQAKAITNSEKLIRRAKAVVQVWGTGEHETERGTSNPWTPFYERLVREGFKASQIEEIRDYKG